MAVLPYVAREGSKSGDVAKTRVPHAVVATLWLAAASLGVLAIHGAGPARLGVCAAATAAVTVLTGGWYARRLGGFTGDFLGATEQLSELVAYAVLAWR
jgi:adenosylcobinamide-GDP ribazoletransferase